MDSDGRLRRRMQRRARELGVRIPAPFSAERFCRDLGAARGRPIHLIPWDTTTATVPCGLWISTDRADYIVYERAAAAILREHIILHELGHLLLGHTGAPNLPDVTASFELLDAAVVERVLGRTGAYDAREEREAEVFASVVGEQPTRHAPDRPRPLAETDA
ncbi:MAG TPA: hypothetical protein VNV66_17610, partial [Pilimelia sp.]|nr:hypothetical protein [Pilimelia sp.]